MNAGYHSGCSAKGATDFRFRKKTAPSTRMNLAPKLHLKKGRLFEKTSILDGNIAENTVSTSLAGW